MKYRLAAMPAPATVIGTSRLDFQARKVVRPPDRIPVEGMAAKIEAFLSASER
jgi:hypothetical protein